MIQWWMRVSFTTVYYACIGFGILASMAWTTLLMRLLIKVSVATIF